MRFAIQRTFVCSHPRCMSSRRIIPSGVCSTNRPCSHFAAMSCSVKPKAHCRERARSGEPWSARQCGRGQHLSVPLRDRTHSRPRAAGCRHPFCLQKQLRKFAPTPMTRPVGTLSSALITVSGRPGETAKESTAPLTENQGMFESSQRHRDRPRILVISHPSRSVTQWGEGRQASPA